MLLEEGKRGWGLNIRSLVSKEKFQRQEEFSRHFSLRTHVNEMLTLYEGNEQVQAVDFAHM